MRQENPHWKTFPSSPKRSMVSRMRFDFRFPLAALFEAIRKFSRTPHGSFAAIAVVYVSVTLRRASCFSIIGESTRTLASSFSTSSLLSTSTSVEKENPRKVGLAFQLDNGTRKSHSFAENTAFVTGFFKGLSNRDSYGKLQTSLYFVYEAMEDAFQTTNEAMVKEMDSTELRRLNSLREDMEYFYGQGWESKIKPTKAAKKYANRVVEIARDKPRLLLAHQYTRYLGDLFGGQMMSSMARKSLSLSDGKGTSFYEFDEIESVTDFITTWYSKLNKLKLSEKEREEIVDEANYVFELNIGILEELDGKAASAIWTLAWATFKEKLGLAS